MNKSLRLLDPDLDMHRRVRIWCRSDTDSATVNFKSQNLTQLVTVCAPEHMPVVLDCTDPAQFEIKCLSGKISIGDIETNHSWKINPDLDDLCEQIDYFKKHNFALNHCPEQLLERLRSEALFVSSGANDFSASANLKNHVFLNGKGLPNDQEWYELSPGDCLVLKLMLTDPAVTVTADEYDLNSGVNTVPIRITEQDQVIDDEFFHNLDHRFFNFVGRKLTNPWTSWHDCCHRSIELSHNEKFNIQKLLLQNCHHIKNRRVVDFGCYQGQYLWPCIALGCESIIGAQPLQDYNAVINEALQHLGYLGRARCDTMNLYDAAATVSILQQIDTVLMLGVIYHLNNHYQLLRLITQSPAKVLIMSVSIFELDHYIDTRPMIRWVSEKQGIDQNGCEIDAPDPTRTWVGYPNASWLIRTLIDLGWQVETNLLTTGLNNRKIPAIRHKGMITVTR